MIPLMVVAGVPLRMHIAFPVLMASCAFLGYGRLLLVSMASLLAHEIAHALAATVMGQRFESIELTPFGGIARMDDAIAMRPMQEVVIALAGPVASMLMAIFVAASGLNGLFVQDFLRMNMVMALVNLLPALPLDGGRAFRALLTERMGRARATRLFVRVGVGIGIAMMLLGVYAATQGIVNPMLFLLGAYLIYAALAEKQSLAAACIAAMHGRQARLWREGMIPVKWTAARQDERPEKLAARLTAGTYHQFMLVDEHMRCVETVDEGEVLRKVLESKMT